MRGLREERAKVDQELMRAKAELAGLRDDAEAVGQQLGEREFALKQLSVVGAHVDDFSAVRGRLDAEVRRVWRRRR